MSEISSGFKVSIAYQYDSEAMWREVRHRSRTTVGKDDLDKPVSDEFKRTALISQHSPIRELRFAVSMKNIPTYVAQQYSRHRISIEGSTDFLAEDVNPHDCEHYVRTQRTDRTGHERPGQDAPVNYDFTTNAQGLIDMSKKRLCAAADPMARNIWKILKSEVALIEPVLAELMAQPCVWYGFCNELRVKCGYCGSNAANLHRNRIIKMCG